MTKIKEFFKKLWAFITNKSKVANLDECACGSEHSENLIAEPSIETPVEEHIEMNIEYRVLNPSTPVFDEVFVPEPKVEPKKTVKKTTKKAVEKKAIKKIAPIKKTTKKIIKKKK